MSRKKNAFITLCCILLLGFDLALGDETAFDAPRLIESPEITRKGEVHNAIVFQDWKRRGATLRAGIALGIFSPKMGIVNPQADLKRFAKLLSGTYGFPVVPHLSFATVGFAKPGELPTNIRQGSPEDINYEKLFGAVLERAIARADNPDIACNQVFKDRPVIFFNLSGLEPENDTSFTAREIRLILNTKKFRERTVFYWNDSPVDPSTIFGVPRCTKLKTLLKRAATIPSF